MSAFRGTLDPSIVNVYDGCLITSEVRALDQSLFNVFGGMGLRPFMQLYSPCIMRLALYPYRKLPTYFSNKAIISETALPGRFHDKINVAFC